MIAAPESRGSGTKGRQQAIKKVSKKEKQRTRKKAKNAFLIVLTGFALSFLIAVIGSVAVTLILFQLVEAGMVPGGNRNPLVFGTFILLFFGTAFTYLNNNFNFMRLFKRTPKKKHKAAEKKKKEKSPADSVKPDFLKFLKDAVTSIQKDHPQLNTFSKFGMNLYMSGACSMICQAKALANDVMVSLLKDSLGLMGTNAASAQSFCDEIPTHGSNPRYAGMIQAGGQAMQNFMSGQTNVNEGLSGLLTEWNLPEKRAAVPNVFTFVFTDIVGSTAMTQRLGNAGAQKAVRAHNDAVRGAIQQYNGREVKHTGDGIMATFPDGPSAVAASIQMLQGVSSHNQASPDVPVEIRVGVNTGEAVEEENDFFGQAIRMTARICDKAADGHAWVSDIVVEACQGQKFKFLPRGKFEMKGIEKPKPLFEIAWTDAHRDELADL